MSKINTKCFLIVIVIVFSGIFFACNKNKQNNDVPLPDISFPKVMVTTPAKFSIKNSDAPVHIVGTVTDNHLKTLNLQVWNLQDSILLFESNPMVNGKQGFTFNESFLKNTSTTIPCILVIHTVDAANNTTIDNTSFMLN
jgi:hypothetical protein